MNRKLLVLGSALAFLVACQNGNQNVENNAETEETVVSWPKLDSDGNYVKQEGDPIFLVSDKFRKQFIHPISLTDTIYNAPEYTKFLWKDFVLKIASGEFLPDAEGFACADKRGPLFVPIDQDESVRLSKQLNTQWFDLMPVAFTEKSLGERHVLSYSDKRSWDDIRKMDDSLQAQVSEKYGLEIEQTEWIANINNNSLNLFQVLFKAKDNKVVHSIIAFKEDGTMVVNDKTIVLPAGGESQEMKEAPSIACVLEVGSQTEVYYIERENDSISTGAYIIDAATNAFIKINMNSWKLKQY